MSYDVYIDSQLCEHCGRSDEGFWRNYTSNVVPIWSAVLGQPLADLDGVPTSEVSRPSNRASRPTC